MKINENKVNEYMVIILSIICIWLCILMVLITNKYETIIDEDNKIIKELSDMSYRMSYDNMTLLEDIAVLYKENESLRHEVSICKCVEEQLHNNDIVYKSFIMISNDYIFKKKFSIYKNLIYTRNSGKYTYNVLDHEDESLIIPF